MNRNNRNNNTFRSPIFALTPKPPMTYESGRDKQKRQKIEWTIEDIYYRTELPIYDDTSMEDYLRIVREFYALVGERPQLTDNAIAAGTASIFRQALRGQASMTFQFAIQQLPNQRPQSFQDVIDCVTETSVNILGHEAHTNQIAYLRDTKKPRALTIDEWFRRIMNINMCLPYMARGERPWQATRILKEIVTPNTRHKLKYNIGYKEVQH